MPKFSGSLALATLDLQPLLASLDEKLKEILIEGTKEWVRTVSAILPNWSGESRASLRPIADLVGIPIFASAVQGAPDRVSLGQSEGTGELITEGGIYAFAWKSRVFHLAYNELNDANSVGFHLKNPGPYLSQRQAQQSFFATINPLLRSLDFGISENIKVIRKII